MIINEVSWLRARANVLCPELRKKLLSRYRPDRWVPCFLQSLVRKTKNYYYKIPVIVQGKPPINLASRQAADVFFDYAVKNRLSLVNGIATELSVDNIAKLSNETWVEKIWLDREVFAVLDVATASAGCDRVWEWGFTGEGITVAVIDTGIHPHPDLVEPDNRIVAFVDFVGKKSYPYDDNGHGTHVAGTVAGNGTKSSGKYRGPAPRASLVGLKVLDRTGSGLTSRVIAAIQWCMDNKEKHNIKVINLSLGSKAISTYKDDLIAQAVGKAWQKGILVCAAAGNDGPDEKTVTTPGIHPDIITVGAMDDHNTKERSDDTVAAYSSRGPTPDGYIKPDLLAPGSNIVSLRASGSYLDKQLSKNRVGKYYLNMSGTSMATPFCAGVAATLLQLHPNYTPNQIKALMVNTCEDRKQAHNTQGSGYLDAFKAISTIKRV